MNEFFIYKDGLISGTYSFAGNSPAIVNFISEIMNTPYYKNYIISIKQDELDKVLLFNEIIRCRFVHLIQGQSLGRTYSQLRYANADDLIWLHGL